MKTAAQHGVALGLAMCVWTLGEYGLGLHSTRIQLGIYTSYLVVLLPVVAIVLAERAEQRRLAGDASFGSLFMISLVVMVTSYVLSTPFFWLYHHVINPGWLAALVAFDRARLVAEGVPQAQIEEKMARLIAGNSDRAQIVGGLIGSVLLGIALGLPTTIALRLFRRSFEVPSRDAVRS